MVDATELYYKLLDIYPNAGPELNFSNDLQLLIAVMLSAQTTDKRVNLVTGYLFKKYESADAFANADPDELTEEIRSLGLAKTKANNLIKACQLLRDQHRGKVPANKESLLSLPGVGEKTANVVLSIAFNIPAIAIDTHVFRVSNRLGIINTKNIKQAQEQIENIIPIKYWNKIHHLLIWHGRRICHAKKPDCNNCLLQQNCLFFRKTKEK